MSTKIVSKYVGWQHSRQCQKLLSAQFLPSLLLLCLVKICSPHTCFYMYSCESLKSQLCSQPNSTSWRACAGVMPSGQEDQYTILVILNIAGTVYNLTKIRRIKTQSLQFSIVFSANLSILLLPRYKCDQEDMGTMAVQFEPRIGYKDRS